MTDISGLSGSAVYDTEPNAAQALLSMAAPSLIPDDAAFTAPAEEDSLIDPVNIQPERNLPKASWLDAMPPEAFETAPSDPDHISSVNSDDNGLYRMFIGVSP
ncbi:hypothetical protein L905_26070 [Agrobacterium sp. TS43]|jgi:hypothetical protein|uniref:hypothetical protein n=1 Tax=Agrobacterium TaxID=357 RepID=UPI0004A0E5DA|nr:MULTISPECIES: hypothetical protein [Agrobacterium]KDR88291.1 hypothetical protein K538_28075 [Agrobacterium tumefaciens GW4]KVK41279.1 hypothetical protein L903_12610 [Agrobacterium sp. JL28]KVK41825.1 hypothetical protein L904_11850 [Agrobacterium sp. LY4]KVK50093.1 hypothetical protein L901_22180 [Agrobacterium sp. D14]KVK54967.1 hypothetical protein L905_26070 [Agrobacterium sp. TS43]